MRAVIQGIDERQAWKRYMQGEDDRLDDRLIRRAILVYRDELAAAARRHARPGTARLVRMDARAASDEAATAALTLEDFAAERGLEDFSIEDQVAAYEEAFGAGGQGAARQSKRRRLIERQLEALAWLEGLTSRSPRPADPVGDWLGPLLAERIAAAGFTSLQDLAVHINLVGARWWRAVPAVGPTKAARVVEWLRVHQADTGLVLGAHVFSPMSRVPRPLLEALVPPALALRPLDKLVIPPSLRGTEGRFRAPAAQCRIAAADDLAAIDAWLAACGRRRGDGASAETRRAYRKEAERLVLWAVLERGRALSSVDAGDCAAFVDFLRTPPAEWCGPRHQERWSPLWRPLEGPLSPASLQRCVAALRSLFRFLHRVGYLSADPSPGLASAAAAQAMSLTEEESQATETSAGHRSAPDPAVMAPPSATPGATAPTEAREGAWATEPAEPQVAANNAVSSSDDASGVPDLAALARHLSGRRPASRGLHRAQRATEWLQATGLRPGELALARCGDLRRRASVVPEAQAGGGSTQWQLNTRARQAERLAARPVPAPLVSALSMLLQSCGLPADPCDPANAHLPLLFDPTDTRAAGLSRGGVYKAVKRLLACCAHGLPAQDRRALLALSPDRLRQTRRLPGAAGWQDPATAV
ncbi:phage integrase family protein [Pseudacidovorax intermedius]|uniref:phage integrase family protein n=1 Tax=Pseudacidovorax intermedius TaxID=433924 RepID=UPI000734E528|nr:phage integrase family protein [Pseudacidovorax intermedius]